MTGTRRDFLTTAGAAAIGSAALGVGCTTPARAADSVMRKGEVKQAIARWCFVDQGPRWSLEELCRVAHRLGCGALELVPPEHWATLQQHDLICAATPSHGFVRGMNNPGHHDECLTKLRAAIEATGAAGFPNVMTFTGFADTSSEPNGGAVSPEEGLENCVAGYRKIVGLAEQHGVTLVLEQLNTRDAAPMKGHPGYQGDHFDYCLEIVRRVDSPALRLLFDAYHVQIMDGDLIRRIRASIDWIGHVQVAGNPGRGPLGQEQEINYPAVIKALTAAGYRGWVAHEFIPTDDPHGQLVEATDLCDV